MKVEYRDGLLFTSIEVVKNEKRKEIDNIVVDTGATQTVILQDCVDDIGIKFTGKEEITAAYGVGGKEYAFIKEVDTVKVGDLELEDYKLDFTGYIHEDINGLLGIDILIEGGFIIDLKDMAIYRKEW